MIFNIFHIYVPRCTVSGIIPVDMGHFVVLI